MEGIGPFYQDILRLIVLPVIQKTAAEYDGIETIEDLGVAFRENTGSQVEDQVFANWCRALGITLETHSTLRIPEELRVQQETVEEIFEEQAGLGPSPAAPPRAGSRPSEVRTPLGGNSFLQAPPSLGVGIPLAELQAKNPPRGPYDAMTPLGPDPDVRSIMQDL